MQEGSIQETANKKNLLLLVMLRWLAVGGQIVTIAVVQALLHIPLPLLTMGAVLIFLVGLNIVSLERCCSDANITDTELLGALLLDVGALTIQLHLSGGALNPFVSLYLLQVILGAILLPPLLIWILVAAASGCFIFLTRSYRDLDLSYYGHAEAQGFPSFVDLEVYGRFLCVLMVAILVVLFVTQVMRNLRYRDKRLSELRQQSAEEEHIVRMGLLASGAAHELGTPLATLSVILNDWEKMPALRGDPALVSEIDEMNAALGRCKDIVSRILLAAGEARSEDLGRTTLHGFIDDAVADWRRTRMPGQLEYVVDIGADTAIACDSAVRQTLFNVFDNALEASHSWVGIEARRCDDILSVKVRDEGPGFLPEILSNFGKPYQSTKNRPGSGLGLFLAVNVLRKLGGSVTAHNMQDGGACVELLLPIRPLSLEERIGDAV